MRRYLLLCFLLMLLAVGQVGCMAPLSPTNDVQQSNANTSRVSPTKAKSVESEQLRQQTVVTDDKATGYTQPQPTTANIINDQDARVNSRPRDLQAESATQAPAEKKSELQSNVPVMAKRMDQFTANESLTTISRPVAPATIPSGIVTGIPPQLRYPSEEVDRENYAHFSDNPVLRVAEYPVSTFSIDVDTGSYTNTRRILNQGRMPVKDAVRVEEFINYFNYDYPMPTNSEAPFNVVTEMGPTPWNAKTYLLHIGIKGYEQPNAALPATNLVFLVDVSGSMQSPDKLELLKKSLQMLTQKLRAEDTISIVVYAGASGVVLEPTPGSNKADILQALESLSAGGSTNGAAGIRLAYLKAQQAFKDKGINRVILATDGDFNVGTTDFEALKNLVEEKRNTGIYLTTLGFGTGNYNDKLMEQLADVGNGNYAYIDSLMEAQKVLVNEMGATLHTIAKDVKIQIEFNPHTVAEYRLIGYENRALRREDFNNDKIDAGEIGAGHTVTAIYEISLAGSAGQLMDPLRYQASALPEKTNINGNELAFLRLRYKKPDNDNSILMETPVLKQQIISDLNKTSERYRFAASVAGFGQLLRGGAFTQHYSFRDIAALAVRAKGLDRYGYRSEFVRLVELADTLSASAQNGLGKQAVN